MNSDNLIFIVSQPRSGSTLLQSILSNNDYINTTSEPWLLLPFLNIFDSSLIEAKYNQQLAVTGVFDFTNKVGGEGVLVEKLRDFLLSVYGPLSIGNVKYILDKTPRYYEILPNIQKVFPEAKIILLKRNPFAVLNSIIDTWGETNTIADLYFFKRDILYAPFLIQTFLEENRSNDQYVRDVIYENLAQNPEEEFKALYEWLEIPYDSSILDYSKNDKCRGLMGDQAGIKERDKPTDESVDTWRKKFTDSYWCDFFKGYAAFLGKEFLISYGSYSIEFIGKDIHETSQFQKFKFFSEDRLIDINFIDAIKDYKKYDLTIRQMKQEKEQSDNALKQLQEEKEQSDNALKQLQEEKEQSDNALNNLQKRIIKEALVIFLRKIHLYNFCIRHKSFFRRIYHFLQKNVTQTTKITDSTNIKTSPSINSPKIEALIGCRSLEGDMTPQSLIYLYELGTNMRHILCVHTSANNIQALYMLSKAGTKVTCLACNQHETELQKYGFTTSQANLAEWMITIGQTTLADYDGLLLDARVEETNILLLKGRLWPKTKILINGVISINSPIKLTRGSPQHTINGLEIYDTPHEDWLDPVRIKQSFYFKTYWPWKPCHIKMPSKMPSGRLWPKISIVTVTLNQGSYLEETLRSVLMQGYPNLEYIVIDGGSTDNTPNILERYRNELTYCISEKDKGQSDALNKGFRLATGDILAWLNSDDSYLPGTLLRVALAFDNYDTDIVAGGCALRQGDNPTPFRIHHNAMPIGQVITLPFERLLDVDGSWQKGDFFYQPEVFFSRDVWERSGAQVDEKLYYSMDYELWLRLAKNCAKIVHIPDTLASFRLHENQKTNFEELPFLSELHKVSAEFKRTLK